MKKGILISLSGVDGSGKSTQGKLLKDYLQKKKKKVLLIQVFGYFLLAPLIGFLRILGKKERGPIKKNRGLFLKFWFILAYFDFWITYFFKIYPKLYKYDVVIADRFFPDLAVSLAYCGFMPETLLFVFARLLPRGEKMVLFLLPAGISWRRSEEFDLSYHKKQAGLYKRLGKGEMFIKVDASKRKKEIFKKISKIAKIKEDYEK